MALDKLLFDIGDELLKKYEYSSKRLEAQIAGNVISEFLSVTNLPIELKEDSGIQRFIELKKKHIYNTEYTKMFFEILNKYNYFLPTEVLEAIFNLAYLKDPNKNENVIKTYLGSPDILDITFNGKDKFTILSETLGSIEFELINSYFKNNPDMLSYIKNKKINSGCHAHVWFMGNDETYKDFYAITSLCCRLFTGLYYHSYTYDAIENRIIDISNKAVFDKETFEKLFEPKIISKVLNSDLQEALYLAEDKCYQFYRRHEILKIALFRQYLDSIGFHGSFEEAPKVPIRK
ncbi:MAG: hypothetical protein J1F35_01655 [Erysipelotrichales bacterium]|nr:hypothetical protein [Erysipelotrichales bacterium]